MVEAENVFRLAVAPDVTFQPGISQDLYDRTSNFCGVTRCELHRVKMTTMMDGHQERAAQCRVIDGHASGDIWYYFSCYLHKTYQAAAEVLTASDLRF